MVLQIGVLALQGDFREHIETLKRFNDVEVREVRISRDLQDLDGLVIPGGESTTISKLSHLFEIDAEIRRFIREGKPVLGTCAGLIMLSNTIIDPKSGQESFGGLNIEVRRNAFGRQVDSFECVIEEHGFSNSPLLATFIRAPWVEVIGEGVEVLARVTLDDGIQRVVAVRQGNVIATSFHPEISEEMQVHSYFLDVVRQARSR
ncbi:MAG: pyridoxal 5'-phosphate synthase glutaminase subunit PdxT [Candidatus Nanopelagicales bacterium]